METDLSKKQKDTKDTKDKEVEATGETLAPVDNGGNALMTAPNSQEVMGEVDDGDFKLPTLHVTQKIGPLSDLFTPGDIVLNKETVLVNGNTKDAANKDNFLELTVLRIQKRYEEIVPYGGDDMPRTVDTLKEVLALGGTLNYEKDASGKDLAPTWRPIANMLVLVKAPDPSDDLNFPYEFEDDRFAIVMWTVRGAAYKGSAQEVFTAQQFYYRDSLRAGSFKLTCPHTKFPNGNSSYIATLRKHQRHSEAFVAWVNELGV